MRRVIGIVAGVCFAMAIVLASILLYAHERLASSTPSQLPSVAEQNWPARQALPPGAVVLHEDLEIEELIGDFSYVLEARMSEAEFEEWMRALHMRRCPTDASLDRWCAPGTQLAPGPDSHGSTAQYADGVGQFASWST